MKKCTHRKELAINKMHIAIENFKQAELEGAEVLSPVTYRWAKTKIYEDRKKFFNSKIKYSELEEYADDACAASAQLLSSVRDHVKKESPNLNLTPDFVENLAIENFVYEGGPAI